MPVLSPSSSIVRQHNVILGFLADAGKLLAYEHVHDAAGAQ